MIYDSNLLILSLRPENAFLRPEITAAGSSASAISKVEVLGFHRLTPDDKAEFETMFLDLNVLQVSEAIIDRAVALRQRRKMSLGDSIIAATALEHGLRLRTHNVADFAWIAAQGLVIEDPLAP